MEKVNLAMRKKLKLELVSYTGHSRPFLRLCEDIKVAIEGQKIMHLLFVVKVGDHELILGQLFLNFVKFSQEFKSDGIFGTITYLYTYQIAVFRTLTPQDLANQRENQIFPQSLNKLDSVYGV